MKLIISILIFLITPLFLVAEQEDITITEGSSVEICGRTLAIDGIWIDDYEVKADISNYMQKNSKPRMGGYKIGDTIEIKNGCRYFVKRIEKFGESSTKGYVILSTTPDNNIYIGIGLRTVALHEILTLGTEEWTITRISKDEAEALITQKGSADRTIILKKNDVIWKGFRPYYISDFIAYATASIEYQWEIEFKKVKDYSYIKGPAIHGEDINKPMSSSELIIRKMKYHPKKRIDEEELKNTPVKYWVLKVLYYHGGIARPVIEVERNGKKMFLEYDAYKSFDTEEEVMEFARVNGITDIQL